MNDNEKLAKALEIDIAKEFPGGTLYDLNGSCVSWSEVVDYLNSDAGEKAVRDKVRELAGHDSVAYYYEPDDELEHTVCISSNELDFCPWRTEAEAWIEALLWLDEQKGSE